MLDISRYDNIVFKGAIDVSLLDDKSRLYQLWMLWKLYIDFFVIGNNHIKKIMFFNLIGIILTHKGLGYATSDKQVMTRIHTFYFQRARSGKGEAMKAKHTLCEYLKILSRHTNSDNTASAVGTCQKDKNTKNVSSREGHLKTVFDYSWDEGSILISKSSGSADVSMTDILQGVMDEPGMVSKGMAWGDIEYATNSSICAGSYILPRFAQSFMNNGFFQRMVISYVIIGEDEKRTLRNYVPLLKTRFDPVEIERIKLAFKRVVDSIPKRTSAIKFKKEDVVRFTNYYDLIYENLIKNQYVGRTQEVLESFSDMCYLIVDKIAAQKAIIEGKDEVTYEDMLLALPIIKIHMASVLDMFNSVERPELSPTERREERIINVIKQYPRTSTQQFIIDRLESERRMGKWDLGRDKTSQVIHLMISKKILLIENIKDVRLLKINA